MAARNRDVVTADHGRELVGIGRAAEKSKERDVIDLRELIAAQPKAVAKRDGDQTCAQRLLHGLAHAEVGRQ